MRMLTVLIACLCIATSAFAQRLPVIGEAAGYSGVLCNTESAGRALGESYALGGNEAAIAMAEALAKRGECVQTGDGRAVLTRTTHWIETYVYADRPDLSAVLVRGEVINATPTVVIYGVFFGSGS